MTTPVTRPGCGQATATPLIALTLGGIIGATAVLARCFIPAWFAQQRRLGRR